MITRDDIVGLHEPGSCARTDKFVASLGAPSQRKGSTSQPASKGVTTQ